MRTHKILIKSKDFSDEQIKELTAAKFEKRPPTANEKKIYVKSALKNFLIGMVGAVFGIVTLGLGYLLWAGIGFLAGVLFIITAIMELAKISKDIRKTKPEDAVMAFLDVVLIGDDSNYFNKKSENYAYDSLCRMVPDFVPFSEVEFSRYISGFREFIKEKVTGDYDDTFLEEFLDKTAAKDVILRDAPGKAFQKAENAFTYSVDYTIEYSAISREENRKRGTAAKSAPYARFLISFDVLLIKSDEYWFFADPMPEWTHTSGAAGGAAPAGSVVRVGVNEN
jgi:hypothetical protein